MPEPEASALQQLIARVKRSPKYRVASPELIASIGARELSARGDSKDAIKATKRRLHQVTGAYLGTRERLVPLEDELGPMPVDQDALRAACRRGMAQHRSTRERLPLLDTFYATLLGDLPPIRSVLDVACALHPLAIPWMSLAKDVTYVAADARSDILSFLERSFRALGVHGSTTLADVAHSCPPDEVDVAFALKLVPLLDRLEKGSAERLLDSINTKTLLVSFPTVSLTGKRYDMAQSHDRRFEQLARGKAWRVERFVFSNELVFRVRKA